MNTEQASAPGQPQKTAVRETVGVLYIIDQLCEAGGAERVLLNMVASLPADRFSCRIATFKLDPSLPIFSCLPCPLDVLPLHRTYDVSALRTAWEIRRLVRTHRIRIVHTFFETSDLWAGPIAKLSGCRVLISSRRDMGILRSAKHRIAYRLLGGVFDEVQTVSEQVRRYCIEQDGLNPAKVRTVYNGVNANRMAAGRCDAAFTGEFNHASHVIASVAHIRKVKGTDVFIRAAARVRAEFPRALFVVLGEAHDPGHYAELRSLVRSLHLDDNVRFLGGLEDVYPVLERSDVFCVLSRSEGFSNALLEAMACGLPCVATRVGGNPELVRDEVNGFLVESEDDAAAARRLMELMANPGKARAMGRRSRLLVEEQFTTERMVEALVRSYESLLDRR